MDKYNKFSDRINTFIFIYQYIFTKNKKDKLDKIYKIIVF